MDHAEVELRVRGRAFQIWLDEGRPDGRDKEHRELAKLAIAEQDGLGTALPPAQFPRPEPIESAKNKQSFQY
jgi:hypothetical protein